MALKGRLKDIFSGGPGKRPKLSYVLFLLIAASMSYYYVYLIPFHMEYHKKADFLRMMHGVADTPFQYRVLMTWLIKAGSDAFTLITGHAPRPLMLHNALLISEMVFLFGLTVTLRYYLKQLIRSANICSILSLSIFLVLPYNYLLPPMFTAPFDTSQTFFRPIFYMYDIPSMFFFTLGVVLLYKRKLIPFYLLFVLATFNRETTCFLTAVYLFTSWGESRPKTLAAHVAAQGAIWLGIKYLLFTLYGGNGGVGLFEIRFLANLEFAASLKHLPTIVSILGGLWIPALLLYRYIPDRFVRRSVMVIIPFFIGMAMVGNIYELRVFGELVAIVIPALVLEVKELARQIEHAGEEAGKEQLEEYQEYEI